MMMGYVIIFGDSRVEIRPNDIRVVHKIASRVSDPVYVYGQKINGWEFLRIKELVDKYE